MCELFSMLAYPKSSIGKRKVTTTGGGRDGTFLLVEDNGLELPIKGEMNVRVEARIWSFLGTAQRCASG